MSCEELEPPTTERVGCFIAETDDLDMHKYVRTIVFTLAAVMVVAAAFAIFGENAGPQLVSNDQPAAGSSGMARPHPPLDRAPGEPLKAPL